MLKQGYILFCMLMQWIFCFFLSFSFLFFCYQKTKNRGSIKTRKDIGVTEFEDLPEGCIANILSLTTPKDASTFSWVSSTFKSAAYSDVVWERFLPSDYRTIIPSSISFPSKKDLYLYLCHNPILIDDGQMSFSVDKQSGKKCYMLFPRILSIAWGDSPDYWRWTSLRNSTGFWEVAQLISVCWFEIKGRVKSCILSPETLYGAYLVLKPSIPGSYGFDHQPVEVSIGIVGEGDTRNRTVYLVAPRPPRHRHYLRRHGIYGRFPYRLLANIEAQAPPASPPVPASVPVDPARVNLEYPKQRLDGWWEIEMGDFFNKEGEEKEVEMSVYEVKSGEWKGGIILQGIELRPKLNPI